MSVEGSAPAARFMALFAGSGEAHVQLLGTAAKADENGKLQGDYRTYHRPPSLTDWDRHLKGVVGLVIIPLRADDTVLFAAIDVDLYPADCTAIRATCKQYGLPFVVARTKSGGARVLAFFTEPVPAIVVRRKLTKIAAALGYARSEIFPKQVDRTNAKTGNGVAVPYQGSEYSLRYAFGEHRALTVEEFLDVAEGCRISREDFEALPIPAPSPHPDASTIEEDFGEYEGAGFENVSEDEFWFEGKGPEHWQQIAAGLTAMNHERHNGIVSLTGLLFALIEPALAEVLIRCFNHCQCDPPLPPKELNDIIRHARNRECA